MEKLVHRTQPPSDLKLPSWLFQKFNLSLLFIIAIISCSQPLMAQQRTITGSVKGESNEGLPGVTVLVKGTNNGTATDAEGNYSLNLTGDNSTLVVSFIGYETQEVAINNRTTVNITLKPDAKALEEVVVIGYGTQRREDVTSSVASVKSENFQKGAVRDVAQLVQGKVSGLRVTTPSGDPAARTEINLRGINSINGSASPLILIDGIPGELNTVAPEDIESVDVLKDGSAAAIYGTRGTGGVILVTTRKNREGRNTISYDGYVNVQTIARRTELLTGDDYRRLIAERGIPYTDYSGNTDWLDQIMQEPISYNHNLTFMGGNAQTNFTGSVNYRDWEGIFLKSISSQLTARADLNHSMFNDKLRANLNFNNRVRRSGLNGEDINNSPYNYMYRQAFIRNPTDMVSDENGWIERSGYFYDNPMILLNEANAESVTREMRVNGSLTYSPINNLDIKLLVSNIHESFLNGYAETKRHISNLENSRNGYASRSTSAGVDNLLEFTTNYSKTLGKNRLTVLGGYSYQDFTDENFSMTNWDFPSDLYSWNNMTAGDARKRGENAMGSNKTSSKLIGFFGRANYSWDGKYLLMASIRREGSSVFGENYQYGSFPAFSAGWRINREGFMSGISTISDLKLRAGYGVTGTIANRPYLSQISYQFSTANGALINNRWYQGIAPVRNPNPDLRWERKEEWNAGLDFGVLNNRISGSVDVYRRYIRDLLYDFPVPTPPYLYNILTINAGTLKNEGLEILVNFVPLKGNNYEWNSNFTYSTNRNELVSLSNDQFTATNDFFQAGGTGEPVQDYTHRVEVGQPIGRFYVWKTIDIDENGAWIIENQNGEPTPIKDAKQADRQYYGQGIPKHILSWNNNIRFGSFDLNATMRGAFGHHILNFTRMFYENPKNPAYNMLNTAYDLVYGKEVLNNDLVYVSHYIEKGDYWKIDNVTLGYNLPVNKIKYFKNARIYLSGQNLVTITGYKGIDPEVSLSGFAPGNDPRDKYPTTRTFTTGINLTF